MDCVWINKNNLPIDPYFCKPFLDASPCRHSFEDANERPSERVIGSAAAPGSGAEATGPAGEDGHWPMLTPPIAQFRSATGERTARDACARSRLGLRPGSTARVDRTLGDEALAAAAPAKPINWLNVSTLVSVAILVGTELIGAGVAAGWAIGGLFALGETLSHLLQVVLVLCALVGLFYFLRAAAAHETLRG